MKMGLRIRLNQEYKLQVSSAFHLQRQLTASCTADSRVDGALNTRWRRMLLPSNWLLL